MPVVSRHAALQDLGSLKGALVSSLSLAFLVTLPAACGLIFLAQPIIALIFQHGQFTAWDTQQTAAALALYAVGLTAFAGVKIMVPAFYALNDTRIPVLGSFLTVAANLGFINLTLGPLQHRAIALSTSLSGTLNFFFLALMLYRKLGGFRAGYLLLTLAKTGCAALVMGVAVFLTNSLLSGWLGSGLPGRLLSLLADILMGGGLYLLLVSRLKIPEFQELTRHLAARLKR